MPHLLFVIAVFFMCGISLQGCTLSDDLRCPDKMFYVPEIMACCANTAEWDTEAKQCIPIPDAGPVDTGSDTDTATDSLDGGPDSGDIDTDTGTGGGGPSGLGTACTVQTDCAAFEADLCTYNSFANAGYCTTKNCVNGGCVAGYRCCDCTANPFGLVQERACLTNTDADAVVSYNACTCE